MEKKLWMWTRRCLTSLIKFASMDILKLFNEKYQELGLEKICETLKAPRHIVAQYVSGSKKPGYDVCQKIVDLWGTVEIAAEPPKDLWQGRDVCLCLPWYKETYPDTVMCLMAMWDKTRMRLEIRSGDSMITRSRNQLAKRFLKTGAAWSIWFDDDMVFPFGHAGMYVTMTNMRNLPDRFMALNTIDRLISWEKTIVGGCYWDRRGGGKLIAGGGLPITQPIPSDGLHAVSFVGTGCLAVHRQVFLDIAEKFPETMSNDSLGNESGFFTNIQTPQRMLGEDESFARRAANAGHPSYLDLGLLCGHIGMNIHGIPANGSKI